MTKYELQAQAAETASKAAKDKPSIQAHRLAAQEHLLAKIAAWDSGNEKYAEHETTAEQHIQAAQALHADDTGDEGDGVAPMEASEAPLAKYEDFKAAHAKVCPGCTEEEVKKAHTAYMAHHANKMESKNAKQVAALQATANKRMAKNTELQASVKDGGFSFNDFQQQIRDAVSGIAELNERPSESTPGTKIPCPNCVWVCDILCPAHEEGETWEAIVQGADGKLYCVTFSIDADSGVSIVGSPKEVEKVTDYQYVFDDAAPVQTKNAKTTGKALEAGRSETSKMKRYEVAACEAAEASDAIKTGHATAASLHKIANEHALMCGNQAAAFMHTAKAKEHLEACEACDKGLPSRMPVSAASGKTGKGLTASGVNAENESDDNMQNNEREFGEAMEASAKAWEATAKAVKTDDKADHATAAELHTKAAKLNGDMGFGEQARAHEKQADNHKADRSTVA